MFFIACFVFINCISAMFDSVCQSMLMLLHPPPSSARSAARLVPPVSLSVVVLPAPVSIGALLLLGVCCPPVSLSLPAVSVVVLPAPVFIGALLLLSVVSAVVLLSVLPLYADGDAALPQLPLARPRPLLPRPHALCESCRKSRPAHAQPAAP